MEEKKFIQFFSRRDSILGVIDFLTMAKLIQIQYLNKDFFLNIIPKMTKKIYWRRPSDKEFNTQPVLIKNEDFRQKYYSRYKNLISVGLYEIDIDENFIKTFKIVVENNHEVTQKLVIFNINFISESIVSEFLKLILKFKNLIKFEFNNKLNVGNQQIFSSNLIQELSYFSNMKSNSFHYINYGNIDKVLNHNTEKLESLSLTSCKLNFPENFSSFVENFKKGKLDYLSLNYEEFDVSNSKSLVTILRNSKTLKYMKFDNCNFIGIDNSNNFIISEYILSNNLKLEKITAINAKNFTFILVYLIVPESLENIEIISSNVNDSMLDLISKNLFECKCINSINFSLNKISFNGIQNFFDKMTPRFLFNLKEISFAGNKYLETQGLVIIVDHIIKNELISLRKLNLTNCGINLNLNLALESIAKLLCKLSLSELSFDLILLRNIPTGKSDISNFIISLSESDLLKNLNVKGNINFYAFKIDYKKLETSVIEIINKLRLINGIILN